MSARVGRAEDVPPAESPVEGRTWHPVRHHLGIDAFGTNAYTAAEAGDLVIEAHEEDEHQELYVVLAGAARFTVDGEDLDAPQGTLVFVTPPSHRTAVALEPRTTVLAIGAAPGVDFEVSAWEKRWRGEAGE